MSKITQKFRYMHLVSAKNLCCRYFFHTSRNIVLPNMARGENYSDPEYAKCFKPAKLPVIEVPCLAGEPRNVMPPTQGLIPEIIQKWNDKPKKNIHRELAKLAVYY